jgi:GT2 family glycosyltransferase
LNNYAAGFANGEYLVLLNNDIEIITPSWIEALLEKAQRQDVGAVGGKLFYPDGSIQHIGIVIGIRGFAGRPHRRFPRESTGYFHRVVLARNCSAVTGALMMVRRSTYLEVCGMDAEHFSISLNDIDLCLRLIEHGYWNVYTPYCEAIHQESASRGLDSDPEREERFKREIRYFRQRHKKILDGGDPFYNPNLSLDDEAVRYLDAPPPPKLEMTGCFQMGGNI